MTTDPRETEVGVHADPLLRLLAHVHDHPRRPGEPWNVELLAQDLASERSEAAQALLPEPGSQNLLAAFHASVTTAAASADHRPGEILGVGGFGAVLKFGIETLKVVPWDWEGREKEEPPEARAFRSISEPHGIITLREGMLHLTAGGSRRYAGLRLERVDTTLADVCHEGSDVASWNLKDRLDEFQNLCRAVQTLHNDGFAHLDLKLANVGVKLHADRAVRLLDLGQARNRYASEGVNEIGGSPGYAAPEQLPGESWSHLQADCPSDLFSLGIVALELLTGRRFYVPEASSAPPLIAYSEWLAGWLGRSAPQRREGLQAHLQQALARDVADRLAETLLRATATDPADRSFRNALRLGLEVRAAFEGQAEGGPLADAATDARWLAIELGTERADLLKRVESADEVLLKDVYVGLSVLEERMGRAPTSPEQAEQIEPVPFDQALDRNARLLLDGKPGAGKTTLLRARARAMVESLRQGRGGPEPLLVRLRDLNDAVPPPSGSAAPHGPPRLLRWFAAWHRWEMSKRHLPEHAYDAAAIERRLAEGRLVLLLDGFDELRKDRQGELAADLEALGERWLPRHELARIVMTTRVGPLKPKGELGKRSALRAVFLRGHVEDLKPDQRVDLARRLLEHVQPNESPGAEEAETDERFLARLDPERGSDDAQDLPMRELAATPVMVTLMVLVHRDGRGPLPARRAALYHRAIDELNRRFLAPRPWIRNRWNQIQLASCLSHVAWEAFRADEPYLDSATAKERVRDWIADWIARSRGLKREDVLAEAGDLAEELGTNSGVLSEPDNPSQRFAHKTISEYLTARALIVRRDSGLLVETFRRRLGDEDWSEVLRLAAALVADDSFGLGGGAGELEALLEAIVQDDDPQRIGALGPVLEEVQALGLGEEYLAPLRERRESLLVPWIQSAELPWLQRVELGDVLGFTGDTRLGRDRWVPVPADPPFEIQRWPVVVGEYRAFVGTRVGELEGLLERWTHLEDEMRSDLQRWLRETGAVPEPAGWSRQLAGPPNRPVVGMDWYEAAAYCLWMNRQRPVGDGTVFLPSADQWALAARSGKDAPQDDARDYPWHGTFPEDPKDAVANTSECELDRTSAVGCYVGGHTAAGEGVWDMAGNVFEWCASSTGAGYPRGLRRVVRGRRVVRALRDPPRLAPGATASTAPGFVPPRTSRPSTFTPSPSRRGGRAKPPRRARWTSPACLPRIQGIVWRLGPGVGTGSPMRVKLFTFRYSSTLGGFDERAMQDFARDKEVLSFREHFFTVNDVPHLACVLTWQDPLIPGAAADPARAPQSPEQEKPPGRGRPRKPDPAAELSEPDRLLYNALREWRLTTAREQGVPPYVIFNNRELAQIVARKPDSPSALGQVPGIGPGKVESYGAAVLALLQPVPEEAGSAPSTP